MVYKRPSINGAKSMIYSYSAVDIRKETQGVASTPYRKNHPIGE